MKELEDSVLQRGKDNTIATYGFLIAVEVEADGPTTPEQVACRIADGLTFMEGIGKVDVEALGKIECFEEEPE